MRVELLGQADYLAAVEGVATQPWNSQVAVEGYGEGICLTARDGGGRLTAAWFCPRAGEREVARPARLLPYASPWLTAGLHPVSRQRVLCALAEALKEQADSVELPLGPEFRDAQAFHHAGFTVLYRHTRVIELSGSPAGPGYLGTARNAIRAASRSLKVVADDPERFRFDRAVVNQTAEAIRARTAFGVSLSSATTVHCLSAVEAGSDVLGQIYVLVDGAWAYSMHSWFDRGSVRGIPSLLVDEAIARCRAAGVEYFDFEGSVLRSIDDFMAGFGADPVSYGQIVWAGDEPSDVTSFR